MPRKRVDDREFPQHTPPPRGVVAQLVEHHNGIVGVISSILFGSTINLASAVMLEPFLLFLNEGGREVSIAGDRGGDRIVVFLAPNLTANFGVDIAAVTKPEGRADEFTVIDLAAGTWNHKPWSAILDDRVFHVDEPRVRNHLFEAAFQ